MSAPLFWITRPKADSDAVLQILMRHGLQAVSNPVMRMQAYPATLPDDCSHIIITSKHALHALDACPETTEIWCVGHALAALLHARGFVKVHPYPKASELLQDFSRKVKPPTRVCYVRGEIVRLDISSLLVSQHYQALDSVCYRSIAVSEITPELEEALRLKNRPIVVLLYAMQVATYVLDCLKSHRFDHMLTSMHAICMSPVIAEEANRCGFKSISTASKPDSAHMIQCALAHQSGAATL